MRKLITEARNLMGRIEKHVESRLLRGAGWVFWGFDGGRGMRSMRKREVVCSSAIEQRFRRGSKERSSYR